MKTHKMEHAIAREASAYDDFKDIYHVEIVLFKRGDRRWKCGHLT